MNLAWLAAVLQPHDVAPHPNFPDSAYAALPAPRLAACVIGGSWRLRDPGDVEPAPPGEAPDLVMMAEQTLYLQTIGSAVPALAAHLAAQAVDDAAQSGALALLTCAGAAELEDYPTLWRVLDRQLARLTGTGSDAALVRAALLQQKALRLQDAGRPHVPVLHDAAAALDQVDPDRCTPFPTSPGVSWTSAATVADMQESLLDALASLTPSDLQGAPGGLPGRLQTVRGRVSPVVVRAARGRAERYATFVAQRFDDTFGSTTRTLGGPARPDLFHEVLLLELVGHGATYAARRELALLRLVQADDFTAELVDGVRLLRHAAARRELDLVLRRLRMAGPLSVLSASARQVLRARLTPELLRTVELRVLHDAAELLAPAEARTALEGVLASLAAGGPPDLPRQWQLPLLREEVAWATAAALANECGGTAEVAELLLRQAESVQREDQLHDQALARAVRALDWDDVTAPLRAAWAQVAETRAEVLGATAEAVSAALDLPVPPATDRSDLDGVVRRLNALLRSGKPDPGLAARAVPVIRDHLMAIRGSAEQGTFSIGGVSEADVAVGLILHAGAVELWHELTAFLLDSAVQREDRSAALERLARSDAPLPEHVAMAFREAAHELLHAPCRPGPADFGSSGALDPYPPALRFLARHRLIDGAVAYEGVAALASGTGPGARREAAITLASLAAATPSVEVLALALPLAGDVDVQVRAHAGRALASVAGSDAPLAAAARRRVSALLDQDGVLAPRLVLRALQDGPVGLAPALAQQVATLAEQHPARTVRQEAGRLLARLNATNSGPA